MKLLYNINGVSKSMQTAGLDPVLVERMLREQGAKMLGREENIERVWSRYEGIK